MDRRHSQAPQGELIHIGNLPQIVPSRACFTCDVCCRFPEAASGLRPYFTRDEIARALEAGLDPSSFQDLEGGQVRLVPSPSGEGYQCPAFDPETNRCGIYDVRPLDCQIYPLALMWSEDGRRVLLGWDEKCPFLADDLGAGRGAPDALPERRSSRAPEAELQAYADEIAARLEQEDSLAVLEEHPRLIGPYQDDVVVLRTLDRVSERLPFSPGLHRTRTAGLSRLTLQPVTFDDRLRIEAALAASGPAASTDLAAYAYAPHMIWRSLLPLSWASLDDHLCLFAESPDGVFLMLPPLGPGPLVGPLKEAFAYMEARNRGSAVSRVENVPEELRHAMEELGYRLRPKDPDYLYRTVDLVTLAGDRYKSQRAACNQLSRRHQVLYRPYGVEDHDACVSLLERWAGQKAAAGLDPVARAVLADAGIAHREALVHSEALGLVGRVLLVDATVAGYTFGYPRSPRTACVLLEVADRAIPGAARVLFRGFAREALAGGHEFINTVDDSGLGSLAASKEHDHPVRLVPSYIATQA